jgi:hypothetical protein
MKKQIRIKRLANKILLTIKHRVGKNNSYKNILCLIDKTQMENFLENNWSRYLYLKRKWEQNGKIRKHSVSIDRLDSNKHYEIGNIQLLPMYLNSKKANKGRVQSQEERKMRSLLRTETYEGKRIAEILQRHKKGETISKLAQEYNLRANYISVAKHYYIKKNKY